MRFKQLNIEISHTFWIEPLESKGLSFAQGDLGQLRLSSRTGKLQLIIKGKLFAITLREPVLFNEIALGFDRANANLVEISRVHHQKDWPQERMQIELALASFNGPEIELGPVDIALDPRALEQAQAAELGKNFDDIKLALEQRCTLSLTDEPEEQYAIAVLGEGALDQLKQIERNESDITSIDEALQQEIKSGLILLGDNLQLAVQQYSAVEFDYLGVRKLVTRSHRAPTRTLRLVRLQLSFSEQQQQMALLATQQLSKIIADQKGYLSTWDRYGESEGEQLLKRARDIGRIEVTPESFEISGEAGNQLSVYVDRDLRNLLTTQDSLLMVSPETPVIHLDDPEMGWQAFSMQMLEDYKAKKGFDSGLSSWEQQPNAEHEDAEQGSSKQAVSEQNQFLEIISIEQNRIVIKGVEKPSDKMTLVQSILGDQVQVERRMAARNAIVEGKSAMPHLGLLIEEGGLLPSGRAQRPDIKPLTSFVKTKIFPKNPPTEIQKKAIKIALNTPDITIIQGPPGTGKTTVITAIIERLNQELDKSKSVQGDILVSGYQHDAVENLLSRLSVNDLPAIKFGQRSGEQEQSNSTDIKLDEWRLKTVEKIYQHAPELKESIAYLQLEHDAIAYAARPSDSAALRLVNKAKALVTGIPGADKLINLLKALSRDLASQHLSEQQEGVRLLRALRLSKPAFMDDGATRAAALVAWLNKQGITIDAAYLKTLQQAMIWRPENDLDFLPQLKEVKQQLLKQFTPRPQLKRVLAREDVQLAIQDALDLLQDNSRQQSKNRALIEYLSDLEGNPYLVQEALAEYNLVYGATTGQSEGEVIRRFKSKSGDGKGYLQYGTVIVDEAARASPRDLMIPMVQAKDRIILVGDHRQLPHMIDESLLEQMEKESEDANDHQDGRDQFNQHIKQSMFEYLFNRAKQLEQQDGKPRTITLDAQYRSHPLLGEFASEQFYEPYGEGYQSPLPASHFSQQLEGIEDKAAVWLDAPARLGAEERNASKSRFRKAEAELIAKQLKQWIDSEQGKGLSFGVISFYKAQVNEVMKALAKYQITEQDEEGNYVIAKDYQMLFDNDGKPIEERLRIGTVDSFQGMEFDVVFLSMVRSQPDNSKLLQERDVSAKQQQRVFGHLMSKSRLCVSVTRQKKVLVLVGDSQLVQSPLAEQAVPELQAFYKLCKNHSQGVLLT
ncbi:AAA family ATPase [Thiopseudomonas alkaliphila]|uniref:AAA family ATPase n=1 Tax=Thiopseudomonas alkaliphila TaxID=1697053 RepID=A0AAW7DT40_9GAMM|nr:AAA domain-containing protein [Thiopseudomonas alkaliphila]MDM1697267.1 AAA family ATPase [Thiopseudomonas alkaliphila]